MPSLGELFQDGEREQTTPAIPGEGVYPVEFTNVRTNCPFGHKLHSDLNGALNIMKRAIGKIPQTIKKPLSFIVGHNRVAPVKGEVTPKTSGKTALVGGSPWGHKDVIEAFNIMVRDGVKPVSSIDELMKYLSSI